MAAIGLKYMAWAKMLEEAMDAPPAYGPGIVLGRAVSTNLTVTNAEGELYADDMLAEYVSEFTSAQLTAEVDNIELPNQATLYGARFDDANGMQHYPDDTAPYGGVGGYQVLMVNNVRKFRAWVFAKAKAAMPDWTGQTKGSSISFGTQPMNLRVLPPNMGPWYNVKEFSTAAAAQAFVDGKLNVKAWHKAQVQVQGADGVTKAVSPVGELFVEDGGDLALSITGAPVAVYDNGQSVISSVAEGQYVVTGVHEAHTIAVIF